MAEDRTLSEEVVDLVATYLQQEGGGMVTGMLMVVEYIDKDGESAWRWATNPGQKMITTTGLAKWMDRLAAYEQEKYMAEELGGE